LALFIDERLRYHEFALEWRTRRLELQVQLADLPALVLAHQLRRSNPHPRDAGITFVDATPTFRLGNAIVATAGLIYGMGEITATLANRLDPAYPTHFNDLRKNVGSGKLAGLGADALGDMSWYARIRELRTEWVHYSCIAVAGDDADPVVIARGFRRNSDKVHFEQQACCKVSQFTEWCQSAGASFDRFVSYLAEYIIYPALDLQQELIVPVEDEFGMPVFKPDRSTEVRCLTLGAFLCERGVLESEVAT